MKKILLLLSIAFSAITAQLYAQCQPAFVRQSIQSGRSTQQEGFFASYNELYTTTKRDSSGFTIFTLTLFDNNQWTDLPKITSKNMNHKIMKWSNKILCINYVINYNNPVSFNNIVPTTGYFNSIMVLKNGQWDSLPGTVLKANFDIKYFHATDNDLYFSKYYNSLTDIYKYDTSASSFDLIASTSTNQALVLPCKDRIYIANTNFINSQFTNGFAYYQNDSLFTVQDSFFKLSSIGYCYVVDYENNYLVGINYKNPNNTRLKYFARSVTRNRSNTTYTMPPNVNGYGLIGNAVNGYLNFQVLESSNNIRYYMSLCDSSNQWKYTPGIQNNEWGQLMALNDTLYIVNSKDHKSYRIGEGYAIDGRMYIDMDEDCVLDSGDFKMRLQMIEFRSLDGLSRYMTSTDTGAKYKMGIINDSFRIVSPGNLTDCSADTVSIQSSSTIPDVSLKVPQGINFESNYHSSRRIRWTNKSSFLWTIKNKGDQLDSVNYILSFSQGIKVDSATSSYTIINDSTIKIHLSSLQYYETKHFSVIFDLDTGIYHPGDSCYGRFNIKGYKDTGVVNKNDSCKFRIVYSYDPNYKTVNREIIPPTKDTRLDYFIEFQNEGNDDAYDVEIRDTLPWGLNAATFALTEASHPFELELKGQVLKITFKNIYLKPKNVNEPKSKGFFTYKIDTKYGIKNGDSIRNRAFIYFDLNAPVVTNYAVTKASDKVVSIPTVTADESPLSIYPNPGSDMIQIHGKGPIQIFSTDGRLIQSYSEASLQLNTAEWSNGIYIISDGKSFAKYIKL